MTSDTDNDGASRSQSPAEDSADQDDGHMAEHPESTGRAAGQSKSSNGQSKSASNAKDPLRPRRKKARRACFACQRAHLTCGDERPCQRCIKRGLQDACADGVRKKAKYLHDAPPESLMPGLSSSHFQYSNSASNMRPEQVASLQGFPEPSISSIYGQRQAAAAYPIYANAVQSSQMPVSLPDSIISPQGYGPQQSPMASQFSSPTAQPTPSMQSLVDVMQQSAVTDHGNPLQGSFGNNFLDPQDLAQYNFDPASFNFGNHYGALEFGMLGHMSSGAVQTPPSDSTSQINQNNGVNFSPPAALSPSYNDSPIHAQAYLFSQDQNVNDWTAATQSNIRQSGAANTYNLTSRTHDILNNPTKQEPPNAFTIGAGGSTLASPVSSTSHVMVSGFEDTPSAASLYLGNSNRTNPQGFPAQQRPTQSNATTANTSAQYRRPRDPSAVYESVNQPYSYTAGFHSLIAFLQRRFSPQKTLRIAKSLASIRPSFLSCTKSLNRDDLIFMEKCFQRTLWEYEDFINACGTPTIVCRRTGEVAAVGKEFSILTGWRKDVLLGKETNFNINTGGTSGAPGTGASSRGGGNTPRLAPEVIDHSRPQPVFLAELLDDDSVIEFYEDFSRMAFGDSRGSVTTRCKLLKYRSKEGGPLPTDAMDLDDSSALQTKRKRANRLPGKGAIAGEAGIDELGDKDGKVDCTCCWTVKRDLFDIPMSTCSAIR
ncbi:Transcriptional regulator of nonfermentable carbon utilization [Xylographa trunciseda]|nr:Transcriptional regulator of nonfermentable carbon utilization [Xylographa trunciseda]